MNASEPVKVAQAKVGDRVIAEDLGPTPGLRLVTVLSAGPHRLNAGRVCYYRSGTRCGKRPAGGFASRLVDPTPKRLAQLARASAAESDT